MTQTTKTIDFAEATRYLDDVRKHLIQTWVDEEAWGQAIEFTGHGALTQDLDGAGVSIHNMNDTWATVYAYRRGDEDTRHGMGYLNMLTLEYRLIVHVRNGNEESVHTQIECMTEVMDLWVQL